MSDNVKDLGRFLSTLLPGDPIFVRRYRGVEDEKAQNVKPDADAKPGRVLEHLVGLYLSHTAKGAYEISVDLSPYIVESWENVSYKVANTPVIGMPSFTLTFSEDNGSDENICGFGGLEERLPLPWE